jgi:hypothetical protein
VTLIPCEGTWIANDRSNGFCRSGPWSSISSSVSPAGERHGYGIILDAEARDLGAVPDVGTLYPRAATTRRPEAYRRVRAGAWRQTPTMNGATTIRSPRSAGALRLPRRGGCSRSRVRRERVDCSK